MTTADPADLCVAIAAARQTARHHVRLRTQLAATEGNATGSPGSLPAELASALADLKCVSAHSWWANATAHTIGRAYADALSWQNDSAEAADAEQLLRLELRVRYGIDVDIADGPYQLVRNQYERYQYERMVAAHRSVPADASIPRVEKALPASSELGGRR